jgi:hypothetical protein
MEAVLHTSHSSTPPLSREVTISAAITQIAIKTDQRARPDLSRVGAEEGRKRSGTYPNPERSHPIDRRPHSDPRLSPDTPFLLAEKHESSPCTCPGDGAFMTKAVWDAISSSPVVIDSALRTHLCPQKSHGKMVSCKMPPATERRPSLGEVTPKSSPNSSPHERKRGGLLTSPDCTCPQGQVTIPDTFWWNHMGFDPKYLGMSFRIHTCPNTLHGRVVCFPAPSMTGVL